MGNVRVFNRNALSLRMLCNVVARFKLNGSGSHTARIRQCWVQSVLKIGLVSKWFTEHTGGKKKYSSELHIFKLTGSRLQGSNRISSMRTLHWGHRVGPSSSSAAHASKHRWWKTCRQCVRIRMSPCWYASSWHTLQTAEPSRPVDTKTRACGLPGKSSSAAGAEWGRWVRICSRPIGVHMVSPSSMDTARHVARLPKLGWNRKTLCCSGRRKECTWLGRLAMVGLAVTKQACKLAMAAGHRSGGIGETKTPGGSWAMFKASRCSVAAMPKQQLGLPSEPVWRSHVSCWTLQPQPGVGWSVVWCWHGFLLASAVATWGTWCCHGVLLSSPAATSWVWCWPGVLLSSGAVSLEVLGAGAGLQAAIGIGACYNCYVTFESGIRWPRRSLPGSARHSRHVTRSCSFWAL